MLETLAVDIFFFSFFCLFISDEEIFTTLAPDRHLLFREHVEVDLGQLHRSNRLEFEIGPALQHSYQRLEGVRRQPVCRVVWHVGHEYGDLKL